ncbi:spore coat-associated protein N [Salibacterium salarium]|uniref:Cell division protein FtsN n=1 Tax=Salibacterium salarium TaxID=284579 RepID=A0A428MWF9_9BACI|nr:CalY family protein [Salibacterium salarium]MDQ0297785.1 spore coat-associated protein N [Salibacterium salarium]RSL30478.1 cell division protein FtsN [Salibacterium salarium]
MGLKKKLGLGVSTAALGLSLIGGGTFAYFSDTADANGTFSAGTIDLTAEPETVIDVDNLKPGDWMIRSFELENNGSLDIGSIKMDTDYSVDDVEGDNAEDFGEHIEVSFLYNDDKDDTVIYSTSLADLQSQDPDVIEGNIFSGWFGEIGGLLEAGTSDELHVMFEFVDNGEDQNEFQGDALDLTWEFEAMQTDGEEK